MAKNPQNETRVEAFIRLCKSNRLVSIIIICGIIIICLSQFADALEKLAVFSRRIFATISSQTQNNADKTQVQSSLSARAMTSNSVETFPSNDFTNTSMTDVQKNDYQLQMLKFSNSPDDLARLCRERFDSGDYVLAINYFAQAMQFQDGVDSWLQDYPFYAGAYLFLGEPEQGWQRFNEMTNGVVAAISFRNNGNQY
jgi:hypothetical protein